MQRRQITGNKFQPRRGEEHAQRGPVGQLRSGVIASPLRLHILRRRLANGVAGITQRLFHLLLAVETYRITTAGQIMCTHGNEYHS